MAEEALALHVEGLLEDGDAIPEPASLDAVMENQDNRDGVAILVSLKTEGKKAVRINITLPEDMLAEICDAEDAKPYVAAQAAPDAAKEGIRLSTQAWGERRR